MAEKSQTKTGSKILGQMHRVMDKTRDEWEEQTNELKREFFKMKTGEEFFNINGKGDSLGTAKLGGFLGHSDVNGVLVERDEDTKTFSVNMDVSGYSEEDISIHVHKDTLTITAKRNEVIQGKTFSREFSRQINLPVFINPDNLTSVLKKDGTLEIECSMSSPSKGKGPGEAQGQESRSRVNGVTLDDGISKHTTSVPKYEVTKSGFKNGISNPGLLFTLKCPIFKDSLLTGNGMCNSDGKGRIIHIEHEDVHRVKWILDLGAGFEPRDITVKAVRNKLQIVGKHEEGASNFKRCKKEYSKEFEIPDNVDQNTLRAAVSPDGKVVIRANTFI